MNVIHELNTETMQCSRYCPNNLLDMGPQFVSFILCSNTKSDTDNQ